MLENEDAAPSSDLQEQLNAANDQLLRSQAEIQNIRRRAERDVESAHKFGLEKFANQLLPVVDNLERALDAIDTNDESQKAIYEGIDLTLKVLDVMAEFKIEAIDPSGEPFDADYHQAVSMVPNPDVGAKHGPRSIPKRLQIKWSFDATSHGCGFHINLIYKLVGSTLEFCEIEPTLPIT